MLYSRTPPAPPPPPKSPPAPPPPTANALPSQTQPPGNSTVMSSSVSPVQTSMNTLSPTLSICTGCWLIARIISNAQVGCGCLGHTLLPFEPFDPLLLLVSHLERESYMIMALLPPLPPAVSSLIMCIIDMLPLLAPAAASENPESSLPNSESARRCFRTTARRFWTTSCPLVWLVAVARMIVLMMMFLMFMIDDVVLILRILGIVVVGLRC
mmetsp:Transcript_22625/g.41498  ORF Transcript_22625/g.41498 Transcript_22625/m.41498 type:complete len:212 (-) Transcript_22625:435-1070(-)